MQSSYGTPLYVTSEGRICENFRAYQFALSARYNRVQVLFAAKANGNLAVMRALARLGAGADVFSGGELALALEPASRHRNCSLTATQRHKPTSLSPSSMT